jgi:hypothetical protein
MFKRLLVGSAHYVPEWWSQNGSKFADAYCINNSIRVVKDQHNVWYVSEDYFKDNDYDLRKMLDGCIDEDFYVRIKSIMSMSPHWYSCQHNGTMLVNACRDILNNATMSGERTELYLIGCDLDYSGSKTHFYGQGTPDPRRIPDDILKGHLNKLISDYVPYHRIYNLGPQPSFLPFPSAQI